MYLPIGAPRIYAASNTTTNDHILDLDDASPSRDEGGDEGILSGLQSPASELKVEEHIGGGSIPLTPTTPGIRPVEHDSLRRAFSQFNDQYGASSGYSAKDPLLSLKLSRSGQIFATITSTALTVWQTKARLPESLLRILLTY